MYFTSMDLSDDTIAVHVYSTCLEVSIIAVSFTIPFICPVHALGPLGGVLGWCCLFVHGLLYFTYIKRVVLGYETRPRALQHVSATTAHQYKLFERGFLPRAGHPCHQVRRALKIRAPLRVTSARPFPSCPPEPKMRPRPTGK